MKRFFNEDDGFFDGDDFDEVGEDLEEFEFGSDEEAFTAFISKQDLMRVLEEDMDDTGFNQEMLIVAISLAEEKLFWKFRSEVNQMAIIERIYHRLLLMRDGLEIVHDEEEEK